MSVAVAISFALRCLLAFVFVRAALHKVRHYRDFRTQLAAYQLMPARLQSAFTVFLILLEAFLALSLVFGGWTYTSYLAAALLLVYAAAMALNLLRGNDDLDCGCSGPAVHLSSKPSGVTQAISWTLVVRNCILVVFALVTAIPLPLTSHRLSMQELGIIALASLAVILIYSSIEQAIANQQRLARYLAARSSGNPGLPL
jgi:hypothetical protein